MTEAYSRPKDSRPEAVRSSALERATIVTGKEAVSYTVIVDESDVLPPDVEVGIVCPSEDESDARPELVIRKRPKKDIGSPNMGDGQRMAIDTEPQRIREYLEVQQAIAI